MRFPSLIVLALAACSTLDVSGTGTDSTGQTSMTAPSTDGSSSLSASGTNPSTTAEGTGGDPTSGGTGGLDTGGTTAGPSMDADYGLPGDAPVGNQTFALQVGDRNLLVEVWYPADAAAKAAADVGEPILEFIPAGPQREAFDGLIAKQTAAILAGVRTQTRSARGAATSGAASYPLIVFSHCHEGTRFSAFSLAEHLASRGFVVAAPDHVGNTLFDGLAGNSVQVGEEFLVVRVGDMSALLDELLDPASQVVPAELRGKIDPARIGAMGHSFGAGTAGRLAQDDERVVAALPIAAPVENLLFPGTKVAQITEPMLFVQAVEDNSIQKIGNGLIEMNFKAAHTPAHFVALDDTGHWGVTDICGITPGFEPGCGPGTRMTDGTAFTYLDPVVVRGIVGAYAAAFFDHYLLGNPAGLAYLEAANPPDLVTVETRT